MPQVLQTNCDYKIKTQTDGIITLDTSEVIVTGDLRVEGETVTVNVTNLDIEDNIITLNKGESGDGVSEIYSGIQVDRGIGLDLTANPYAAFLFNESSNSWEILLGDESGYSFRDSNIRTRRIYTDPFTDGGNLTLIGTGTGVVSVAGTTDYEQQVTEDDDIPNKKYVDFAIYNRDPDNEIRRDDTAVIVQDIDGGASARAVMSILDSEINIIGAGYEVGDQLFLVGGTTRRAAIITVDAINGSGGIDAFTVTNSGGFVELPPSNFNIATTTDGLGFGATFDIIWEVQQVEIISPGDDYESATVTFQTANDLGSGPITATGTVTVDSDPFSETYRQIQEVTVTLGGEYDFIPAVTFASGANPDLTESRVRVVVDGTESSVFYEDRVAIEDLLISQNEISNTATDENILLTTTGAGSIEINRAIQLEKQSTFETVLPYVEGATLLYANPDENVLTGQTLGGTGLYFNNKKQTLSWEQWVINNPVEQNTPANLATYPVRNELISKQKALVMSMLF